MDIYIYLYPDTGLDILRNTLGYLVRIIYKIYVDMYTNRTIPFVN